MRVKVKFTVKNAVGKDSSHTVFLTVILTLTRTSEVQSLFQATLRDGKRSAVPVSSNTARGTHRRHGAVCRHMVVVRVVVVVNVLRRACLASRCGARDGPHRALELLQHLWLGCARAASAI